MVIVTKMSNVSYEMLLHPELLTNQQLLYVITERRLKIPDLEQMSRDSLLEVFHNFCVPYAQRRQKDIGSGKVINKNKDMDVTYCKLITRVDVIHSHKSILARMTNESLKTPPDLLSGHIKRIKLSADDETIVPSNNEINTNKRKITELQALLEAGIQPAKKERKMITWP